MENGLAVGFARRNSGQKSPRIASAECALHQQVAALSRRHADAQRKTAAVLGTEKSQDA
jgi:hypothetical protein